MSSVLQRFRLRDPEEFVLRLIAAAVVGGARTFRADGSTFAWDGELFSFEELHDVVGGTEPRKRELAIAIVAARELATEVVFESAGGRLRVSGQQLTLQKSDGCQENRLHIARKKSWRRVFVGADGKSGSLLRSRARWAPLRLEIRGQVFVDNSSPKGQIEVGRVTEPASEQFGYGSLTVSEGSCVVVHRGVTYPVNFGLPRVSGIWWNDHLPLDASCNQLVRGPELDALREFIRGIVTRVVLRRQEPADSLSWVVDVNLERPSPEFAQAPLFRRATGKPVSYGELRAQYAEDGLLPIVARAGRLPAWQPERAVVVEKRHEFRLLNAFHNAISLEEVPDEIIRLPSPENYLVRLPSFEDGGEIGLRRRPDLVFRNWDGRQMHSRMVHPFGLDVAAREARPVYQDLPLPELYECLLHRTVGEGEQDDYNFHLVSFFWWLSIILAPSLGKHYDRQGRLKTLLNPAHEVSVRKRNGNLLTGDLILLARRVKLQSPDGPAIDLVDLLARGRQWRTNQQPFLAQMLNKILAPAGGVPSAAGHNLWPSVQFPVGQNQNAAVVQQVVQLLGCERWDETEQMLALLEGDQQTEWTALYKLLSGRAQEGVELLETLLERRHTPEFWLNYAEGLIEARRLEDAAAILETHFDDSGQSLCLLARAKSDPAEVLELCLRAEGKPDCVPTVAETKAYALLKLGRKEEAKKALRQFVEVPPETVLEAALRSRQARARALLEKL